MKRFRRISVLFMAVALTLTLIPSTAFGAVSGYFDGDGRVISKTGRLISGVHPYLDTVSINYVTCDNGKYVIKNVKHDFDYTGSVNDGRTESYLYTGAGKLLLSGEKYCMITYLGMDRFAAHTRKKGVLLQDHGLYEADGLRLYNAKTGKFVNVKYYTDEGCYVHPYAKNGLAMIENAAFYVWTGHFYYAFMNKSGKVVRKEQMYSFASGYMPDGYLYTMNDGDGIINNYYLSKQDKNGRVVKRIKLPKSCTLYVAKYKDKLYVAGSYLRNGKLTLSLYNSNLKIVKSFEIQDAFDYLVLPKGVSISYSYDKPVAKWYDPKGVPTDMNQLHARIVSIYPYSTSETCLDVQGWSTETSAYVSLYNHSNGQDNQKFVLEKVGTDKYRIWSIHSGKQLRSFTDKNDWTNLQLGVKTDNKNQVFTIKKNDNGSYSIMNNEGKYLTMAYGSTDSGTLLPFADKDTENPKQQFKFLTE